MKTCLSSRIFTIFLFVCVLGFLQYPHVAALPAHAPKFDLMITNESAVFQSNTGRFVISGQVVNLGTYTYNAVQVTGILQENQRSSTVHCSPPFLAQGEVCTFQIIMNIGMTSMSQIHYSVTANGE